MSTTDITTWGHSGVRLERDGQRLVIDPGLFSEPALLDRAGAVLVTHDHADHVVPDRLAATLTANVNLAAWAPAPVVEQLVKTGAPQERVHVAAEGDDFTAAGFTVRVVGREHAPIHPGLPTSVNVAYLIDGVALHPGDSFTTPPDGATVEVLFLPIAGPWLKVAEAVDYLHKVHPTIAVPIHDAVLSEPGKMFADQIITALAGDSVYKRLKPGEALTSR